MGKLINLLVIGFIISTLSSPLPPKSKANKQAIGGKQYIVLANGARPLQDNPIYYKSCDRVKCAEVDRLVKANLAKIVRPNSIAKKLLANRFLATEFSKLSPQAHSVHTDFNGNYSFTCPANKCLVFSSGKVGTTRAYWLKVITPGVKFDLAKSSAIYLSN